MYYDRTNYIITAYKNNIGINPAGKEYTVDIIGMGKSGDGIARVQSFVIFVKNAKTGDKNVKIKINSVGNRFALADVVSK